MCPYEVSQVNNHPSTPETPPKLFNTSTDRYECHDLVNQKIKLNVKLKTNGDIDSAVKNFTNVFQSAAIPNLKYVLQKPSCTINQLRTC